MNWDSESLSRKIKDTVIGGNSYLDQELDSVIRLKPTGRKPPCVIIECHSSHTVTKIPEPPKNGYFGDFLALHHAMQKSSAN